MQIKKVIMISGFQFQLFCKLFSLVIVCCLSTNCSSPTPANNVKKQIVGDFIIKTPPEKGIVIDAPRMLQTSQEKIEEELGESKPTPIIDGVEERTYLVKGVKSQENFEVKFGYFNGKPLYCRFFIGGDGVSDWETALNLAGVDAGRFYSQKSSPGKNYWYRGKFENHLFDLTAIIDQVDDVTINKGIDWVVVKIYLPDEIVFDARQSIGKAKAGVLEKREIERIKNKLKTILEKDAEYNSAQQLIKEIDETLSNLAL